MDFGKILFAYSEKDISDIIQYDQHAVYLKEGFEDGRVGVGEEDDGEERADAAVEHRGPDVGHRVLGPLVAVACKGRGKDCRFFFPKDYYGDYVSLAGKNKKGGPTRARASCLF